MRDRVCQMPGCWRTAWHPNGKGYLCTVCRRQNRSNAYFSPTLFWGMCWLLGKERMAQNQPLIEQSGEVTDMAARGLTVREIRDLILDPERGLNRFFQRIAELGIEIPKTEIAWLERFAAKVQEKGQRRILSNYLRMAAPRQDDKEGWLVRYGKGAFRTYAKGAPSAVETVLLRLRAHDGVPMVLTTPWMEMFPKRLGA